MISNSRLQGGFRIDGWSVDPARNRLVAPDGARVVTLEPKIVDVLVCLALHAGEVVSRTRLLDAVWPDTAVGDDPLNRAISELRRAFGDSARQPRYIETIPKRGYRLIAPVEGLGTPSVAIPPRTGGNARRVVAAVAAIVTLTLVVTVAVRWRPSPPARTVEAFRTARVVPLTSYPGRERGPSLSPDGTRVAFTRTAEGGTTDIWIAQVGSDHSLRLTHGPGSEFEPTWSEDGARVAFIQSGARSATIDVVPAIGGEPRRLYTSAGTTLIGHDWAPACAVLVTSEVDPVDGAQAIWRIDLADDGRRERLTFPAPPFGMDTLPRISPDCRFVAFRRERGRGELGIHRVPLSGGTAEALTPAGQDIGGFDWTPDGAGVVYSSNATGAFGLWYRRLDGEPEWLGPVDAFSPSLSTDGRRMAFERRWVRTVLAVAPLGAVAAVPAETDHTLIVSSQHNMEGRFSPDGRRVAFVSSRTGSHELWVADRDGGNQRRLTAFDRPASGFDLDVAHPRWSPDGTAIVVAARTDDGHRVFVVAADSGTARRLTDYPGDQRDPCWAADGHVYFIGGDDDGPILLRAAPTGGALETVVTGAVGPVESDARGRLYFRRAGTEGVWRLDPAGGAPAEPISPHAGGRAWVPTERGIYYVRRADAAAELAFFDVVSRQTRSITRLEGYRAGGGIDLSPAGDAVVYPRIDINESDIDLLEVE